MFNNVNRSKDIRVTFYGMSLPIGKTFTTVIRPSSNDAYTICEAFEQAVTELLRLYPNATYTEVQIGGHIRG